MFCLFLFELLSATALANYNNHSIYNSGDFFFVGNINNNSTYELICIIRNYFTRFILSIYCQHSLLRMRTSQNNFLI